MTGFPLNGGSGNWTNRVKSWKRQGDVMNMLTIKSLEAARKQQAGGAFKKLPVGQLRIATIPQILRPARTGTLRPEWLRSVDFS